MTEHRLVIQANGEVRDANGNIKSQEVVNLSGLFTDEELDQIMHKLNVLKETS